MAIGRNLFSSVAEVTSELEMLGSHSNFGSTGLPQPDQGEIVLGSSIVIGADIGWLCQAFKRSW